MGNADLGRICDAQRYNRCAESASLFSARERNCRVWHNWSNGAAVGRCPSPTRGAPLTLQGTLSLTLFGLPAWSLLHTPLPQIFLSPPFPFPSSTYSTIEGRAFPLQERSDAMPTPYFEVAHLTKHFSTMNPPSPPFRCLFFLAEGQFLSILGPAAAENPPSSPHRGLMQRIAATSSCKANPCSCAPSDRLHAAKRLLLPCGRLRITSSSPKHFMAHGGKPR